MSDPRVHPKCVHCPAIADGETVFRRHNGVWWRHRPGQDPAPVGPNSQQALDRIETRSAQQAHEL